MLYTHTHTGSILKKEKGAITLYVTIICLFILIIRNSRIHKYKQQTNRTISTAKTNRRVIFRGVKYKWNSPKLWRRRHSPNIYSRATRKSRNRRNSICSRNREDIHIWRRQKLSILWTKWRFNKNIKWSDRWKTRHIKWNNHRN